MNELGYVVIEWNQASGQPRVVSDIHPLRADAEDERDSWEAGVQGGRRERYTVAELLDGEG